MAIKLSNNRKIARPIFYLITEGQLTDENYPQKSAEILETIKKAVRAEISLIQIREKNLSGKMLFELTRKAVAITENSSTKLLVNDRADIAFAACADGVHLTSVSIPTEIIRRNFPENFIVGVSCHGFDECLQAKNQGADFAVLSPIFETPNKGKPLGRQALREISERLKPFPIVALGGINETNCSEVSELADGFAAIRFLNDFYRKQQKL